MLSIDTLELTTSTDYITSLDASCFSISNITKPNGMEIVNYTLNKKPSGINKITVNKTFDTVRVNASAKILGSNYPKGICLNTLDQFADSLNTTGIVLDKEYLNNSQLSRLDVKSDLKLVNDNSD